MKHNTRGIQAWKPSWASMRSSVVLGLAQSQWLASAEPRLAELNLAVTMASDGPQLKLKVLKVNSHGFSHSFLVARQSALLEFFCEPVCKSLEIKYTVISELVSVVISLLCFNFIVSELFFKWKC
jgi:hypothetical protein